MKKPYLTIGVGVFAILVAGAVLVHSLFLQRGPSREDAAPAEVMKANDKVSKALLDQPSKPGKLNKPEKSKAEVLRPEDLPAEVVTLVRKAMPGASIEVAQGSVDKGVFVLKLAAGDKTGSAKLKQGKTGLAGTVSQDLGTNELPSAVVTSLQQAVPGGVVESASRRLVVGGKQDGEVSYEWTWANGCSGEASADGRQITLRQQVASEQVPAAVADALKKAFPEANLASQAERVTDNGLVRYVTLLLPADGGKKLRVVLSDTGEILKTSAP